jgi:signal transduction histidine kinase
MQLGEGVAGQVLRDGVAINIGDIHADPRFLQTGDELSYSSLLVAPVQTSGRQIGTISVEGRSTHAFSDQEAELLEALGSQAAIVIENTRLFETTAHSLDELSALYQINQRLVASLDPDILMKEVVDLLQESFHYYHVQVYLMHPEQQVLILGRGSGAVGGELKNLGYCIRLEEGIVGHVAHTRAPFLTNDVDKVDFYSPSPLLRSTKAEVAAPIKINDEVLGVLDIQQTAPHWLTERDVQIAGAVAEQLAVALQKAGLYANLQTALEHEKNMRSQLVQSERLSLMGKLLASVSHELNNPLQTIQNALFLIRDDLRHADIHLEEMDIIAAEIDRMAMLLERLRSTYRPLHAEDFGPVQINDIIQDTDKLLATYLRHKNISFEFLPDPAIPFVTGLANHLRQVMLNLFINAVEAMPDGGHFCVETTVTSANREVAFSVMDSGAGIEPELLPKIFDPFVTNKKTGTGLGLTITHEIVEQHQGRILAENIPGGGARITVWLPVWKEAGA